MTQSPGHRTRTFGNLKPSLAWRERVNIPLSTVREDLLNSSSPPTTLLMIHNLSLSTYLLTRADGWRPGPHLLACRCSFRCRPESPCRWRECWGPSVRWRQSPPSSWPPSPSQSPRSPPAGSQTCTWTGLWKLCLWSWTFQFIFQLIFSLQWNFIK